MFHIAIENTSMKNAFSEKLIDCFQTRTVPIHYGCPNISDYFNINGVIVVNNLSEIITACNKLTPKTYDDMLPAIEDNFNKSHDWCDDMKQLRNRLIKLINENI
jgi:GH15 family glucan-1,4-alpha-glucosidase